MPIPQIPQIYYFSDPCDSDPCDDGRDPVRILPRCRNEYCTSRVCRRTEDDFGSDGYDSLGYNREGYNRGGYDSYGYNEYGYNRYGYNYLGRDADGYNVDGYNSEGYNRDGVPYWGGVDRNKLHDCSYRPELKFHGTTGPYFGLEIEITTDCVSDAVGIIDEESGGLIYCKRDGSVDGLEAVTHPMSYEWAMANFPWHVFPRLRKEAGCTVVPSDNGIHIHVSRTAFSDPSHLYKWLKLWYRNPSDIQRLARRSNTFWASFSPDHRHSHKEHCKLGKPGYSDDRDETLRSRYSAINTTNMDTLEIRVFASSLRPQRVRAYLQLAAASVEYTRHLTFDAVRHSRGWDWQAFMAWARKSGQYPDLVAEDRARRGLRPGENSYED